MHPYLKAELDRELACKNLAEECIRHDLEVARQKELQADARRRIALHDEGVHVGLVETARTILQVNGTYARAGDDRKSVIDDAIAVIANATDELRSVCFCTKSYDRWHGQRSDHSYGMGPRHGSIIFSVGLRREVRERDLTEDERVAAIYYLRHIEMIEAVDAKAKAE